MDSPASRIFLRTLKFLIVAGMFAAGAMLYAKLPASLPVHWNFAGQADNYYGKLTGTWLIPGIALLMALLFPLLRAIDPKRENYESFAHAWEVLQLCIVGFMAYVYGMQLYLALQPSPSSAFVGRFVTFGVGALFVIIGNYMGKIRQNYFIGLRTPWSLSDPEVWTKSQRIGGWAFVLGGIAIMAQTFFGNPNPWMFFGIVILISVLPIVYSYLIYKKKKALPVLLLLGFVIIAAIAVVMRLTGSEDDWICSKGRWVPHGRPSTAMPVSPCP